MEDAIHRGRRKRKREKERKSEKISLSRNSRNTRNFFHSNPTLVKMNEDPMMARSASKKGRRWWLSTGGNFSKKTDTWPAYEGQRWSRKWCVLWFYNANGWPKGIPDRWEETVTHGCRFPDRTRTDSRYVCARGWPLFSCPLRNWVMSRHVAWVYSPIKSISGFWRDAFFTSPYIILSTLLLSRFSAYDCAPRLGKDLIYRGSPRCFEASPFFRIFRNLI